MTAWAALPSGPVGGTHNPSSASRCRVSPRWKYHLDMQQISPEDSVAATPIPVLLIHGQIDSNIPVRHSRLIHARNPNTQVWEVPSADHCGAISTAPQEFEDRLLAWFVQH